MPYWRLQDLGFRGVAYPFQIDDTGRVALADTDAKTGRWDSLAMALKQLITTRPGERFFNRSFGARPSHLLFRLNRPEEIAIWAYETQDILRMWEPRLELTSFDVVDYFESTAIVNVGFRVVYTELYGQVQAELPLELAR
jgi:phage baseplate assembly protein W